MAMEWPFRSALQVMKWPAFVAQGPGQKLAMLFQLEQNQWRTPERISASQLEQAREVVAFAAATVPYYRERLGAGSARQRWEPKSWRELPILSRKALHDAGPEIRSTQIPSRHGQQHEIMTSGSTGMVVRILGTELTQFFWEVFCLRDHLWHRRELSEGLVVIKYQGGPKSNARKGIRSDGWGPATNDTFVTGPSLQFDILEDIDFLADAVAAERPGYLLTHPSVTAGLARFCRDRNISFAGLREVRTLGESPPPMLRDLCREAWGVPVVDMYSCQEAGYLALQCPDHEHLHVQSENVLLEVVDSAGRPCGPGEVGRVLITSLNNFATPLIRYEIGDYAEVGPPCPCGRGLPVLKRVMGRYRNLLRLPDGTRRFPLMGYERDIAAVAPIELMQMAQTGLDEIEVRLVMSRPLDDAEEGALTTFIHENLGYPFRLRFRRVETIRNPANGKLEQFISLVDQDR